jgi:hypothetical protein
VQPDSNNNIAVFFVLVSNNEPTRAENERALISAIENVAVPTRVLRLTEHPNIMLSGFTKIFSQSFLILRKFLYRLKRRGVMACLRVKLPRVRAETTKVTSIVTYKHLLGIAVGLQTTSSFVIVLENDAMLTEDSMRNLLMILSDLALMDSSKPLFVDLAGGLTDHALSIGSVTSVSKSLEAVYPRTTNTACAYLINRQFARELLDFSLNRALSVSIPIDWLLNFFIDSHEKFDKLDCLRSKNRVFTHGSIHGGFTSWQG